MEDRVIELVLKAVHQLPEAEQDEVLRALLGEALPGLGARRVAGAGIGSLPIDLPAGAVPSRPGRIGRLLGWPSVTPEVAPSATDTDTELKVLPVRLPVADYERLRAFSREHGFSMAVIIRTLVERFLDEHAPAPQGTPDGDDEG